MVKDDDKKEYYSIMDVISEMTGIDKNTEDIDEGYSIDNFRKKTENTIKINPILYSLFDYDIISKHSKASAIPEKNKEILIKVLKCINDNNLTYFKFTKKYEKLFINKNEYSTIFKFKNEFNQKCEQLNEIFEAYHIKVCKRYSDIFKEFILDMKKIKCTDTTIKEYLDKCDNNFSELFLILNKIEVENRTENIEYLNLYYRCNNECSKLVSNYLQNREKALRKRHSIFEKTYTKYKLHDIFTKDRPEFSYEIVHDLMIEASLLFQQDTIYKQENDFANYIIQNTYPLETTTNVVKKNYLHIILDLNLQIEHYLSSSFHDELANNDINLFDNYNKAILDIRQTLIVTFIDTLSCILTKIESNEDEYLKIIPNCLFLILIYSFHQEYPEVLKVFNLFVIDESVDMGEVEEQNSSETFLGLDYEGKLFCGLLGLEFPFDKYIFKDINQHRLNNFINEFNFINPLIQEKLLLKLKSINIEKLKEIYLYTLFIKYN